MRKIHGLFGIVLLAGSLSGTEAEAVLKEESVENYRERMEWFAEAQYGMFIHFGLYSVLGGEWQGEKVDWYSEWIPATKKITREEYAPLIHEFNPVDFDAEFLARTAKESGMKYLVITSKHHDGFCLWDSAYTDFDVGGSPFKGRDILKELEEACARHGLRYGIYYSIIDWHHPSQDPSMKGNSPMSTYGQTVFLEGGKEEYVEFMTKQVLELIENYNPAMLWFDADWVNWWTLDDGITLYNTIREADPDIIVNNRVAKRDKFDLDFVTQEQGHFNKAFPKHWEGCYTMNGAWGYHRHDHKWKSAQVVYDKLKDINEKGGNLLLNVGPDARGVVQPEAIAILRETAELLKAKPITKNIPEIHQTPGTR